MTTTRTAPIGTAPFTPPPSTQVHWFVCAPFAQRSAAGGRAVTPRGTVHAREIGSPTTACGTPAQSWQMCFDQPFRVVGADVCRDCIDEVQRTGGVMRKVDRQRRRVRPEVRLGA
jgi:hypothetical protein